jgi:cathepsin L
LLANQNVKLSEQQIIDCSQSFGNNGCTNGFYGFAFQYVMKNPLALEADYPYRGAVQPCSSQSLFTKPKYKISSFLSFNGNDCSFLENMLLLRPVIVSLDGVNFFWQFYSSGVLS